MEQETIDLSHLTAEERAKLVAVIEADEELRLNCLRYNIIDKKYYDTAGQIYTS